MIEIRDECNRIATNPTKSFLLLQ